MHSYINNFLTANMIYANQLIMRRLILLNVFLLISVITMLVFTYLNYFAFNAPVLALLDLCAAAASLFAIVDLRINHVLQRAILIGTACLFIFFLSFAYVNQNSSFGLVWTIFFPIFAITLNGHQKGLLITVIFYILLLSICYGGIGTWENGAWDMRSFLRLSVVSAVLSMIVYTNEMALYRSDKLLEVNRTREYQYLKELEALSTTDALTELHNRRKMLELIENEIEKAKRYKRPLSLVIFDVDNFKQINDVYGHNDGDEVLKEVSKILRNSIRTSDYAGRWGGEEFVLLCTETQLDTAVLVSEKIRHLIHEHTYAVGEKLSCSFGIANYQNGLSAQMLINNADKAMYQAKRDGKNRVVKFSL